MCFVNRFTDGCLLVLLIENATNGNIEFAFVFVCTLYYIFQCLIQTSNKG